MAISSITYVDILTGFRPAMKIIVFNQGCTTCLLPAAVRPSYFTNGLHNSLWRHHPHFYALYRLFFFGLLPYTEPSLRPGAGGARLLDPGTEFMVGTGRTQYCLSPPQYFVIKIM